MGLFDHEANNALERMFDWNHDGRIDPLEHANMFIFLEDEQKNFSNEDDEDEDEF